MRLTRVLTAWARLFGNKPFDIRYAFEDEQDSSTG
jgi:hypothetical protein